MGSYGGFSRSQQIPIPSSLTKARNYVQNTGGWNENDTFLKYILI